MNQKEEVDSSVIFPHILLLWCVSLVLVVQSSCREAEECVGEDPGEEFQGRSLLPVQLSLNSALSVCSSGSHS